jgi:hypothetical protein
MTLADSGVVELLRGNMWRPAELDEGVIIPRGVMVREIWHQHRQDLDAIVRFLTTYCDESNYPTAAQTVSNPLFDGRNFRTGTYRHLRTRVEVNQERQQVIRQYLVRVTNGARVTFSSERGALEDEDTTLYKRSSTKIDAPTELAGTIYRADNTINEDDGTYDGRLVYSRGNAHVIPFASRRTAFLAQESVLYRNSSSALTAPDVTGSGMYDVSNSINQFGLYDAQLVYQYGTGQGQGSHASLRSALEDGDRLLYKNSNSIVDAPEDGQGYLYQADNSLNDDGTYDARLQYTKGNEAVVGFVSLRTAFRQRDEVQYQNSTTKVEPPATVGSGMYQANNRVNQFGLYDGSLAYDRGTGQGQGSHASLRSALEDGDRLIYKNSNSIVDAPEDGQGYLYQADNTLNDDGTYDARLQYSKGNEALVGYKSGDSALTASDSIQYQNSLGSIEAPTSIQGQLYQASNRVNQFGLYDGSLTCQTAKAHTTEQTVETLPTGTGAEIMVLYRNATTVPAATANTARSMYRQEFRVNDTGLYDGQVLYKGTNSNEYGTIMVGRSEQTDTSQYQYENRDTPVSVPSGSKGSAVWRRNVADGTWSGQLNIESDKPSVTWWGGTGEMCFAYETTIKGLQYTCYVYDKFTRSQTAAENHLNAGASVATAIIIGANDGHIMDMVPVGMGRLRARRLELLYG